MVNNPCDDGTLHAVLKRARRELRLLVAIFVCGLALLGFLAISSEVTEGDTRAIDSWIIERLRVPGQPQEPVGPVWLETAAENLTSLGSIAVLTVVTLSSLGFLILIRKYVDALLLLSAALGGLGLSTALKSMFGRPRPDILPEAVAHLNASFPSGHAMLAAVTYFTLAAMLGRSIQNARVKIYLFAVALVIAGLVGLTRIYLGLHWPTDVLAGWCMGSAWAAFCLIAADLAERHLRPR